jgi:hypothetical protein
MHQFETEMEMRLDLTKPTAAQRTHRRFLDEWVNLAVNGQLNTEQLASAVLDGVSAALYRQRDAITAMRTCGTQPMCAEVLDLEPDILTTLSLRNMALGVPFRDFAEPLEGGRYYWRADGTDAMTDVSGIRIWDKLEPDMQQLVPRPGSGHRPTSTGEISFKNTFFHTMRSPKFETAVTNWISDTCRTASARRMNCESCRVKKREVLGRVIRRTVKNIKESVLGRASNQ